MVNVNISSTAPQIAISEKAPLLGDSTDEDEETDGSGMTIQ